MMKTTCIKTICLLFSILVLGACSKDEEVFTGNITGKVTDAATGEVLQGVTVTITPGGDARTTGSDGYFEFRDLEPKQYEIQARKSGYTTNNKTVTVITGYDVPGDIQLAPVVQDGKLALSVSSLNFGSQNSSLSFSVLNNGNATFNWNISGLDKVDWLSVNPTTGTLVAGKSNAVTVTLNRDRVTEYKEATILVNADDESVALKITAEAEVKTSKIALTSSVLNFGTEYSSLTFDVKNIGNAGDVNWDITGIDAAWIKVTPTAGTTAMGKSSAVKVDIDREKLVEERNTTNILVNADGESLRVTINAEKGNGNNDDGNGGGYTGEVVVPYGLYTYYKFEENFDDSSENMLHGFGMNSPTFVEGVTIGSKAVKFNRTGNSSFVVAKPIIDSREMTISFWGRNFSDGNIFYMISSVNSQPMFTLSMSGEQLKFVVTRYNNGYQYANKGTFMHPALTDAKWHHIVFTSDFNRTTYGTITTTLYVDGQAVDVITEDANPFSEVGGSQSSYDTGTKFVMGGSIKLSSSNTLNGTNMVVDNFRVYDTRMLTADEIKTIYEAKQ